jgi:glycosyltransferase involved in cell wall biosynthesis
MVGTLEPRKGHTQTIAAFEKLWADGVDVNLVVVGRQGWMMETLVERLGHHPELNKHLFWLNGISDELLEKVYSSSACLIAASEGEGFGLPLIEAAQHKLPIIARDIPVFREVAGNHAFYFTGTRPDELTTFLHKWLTLLATGEHPKSDDMSWLTWEQSSEQLKTAMQTQDNKHKNDH